MKVQTNEGNPTVMTVYGIGLTLLIDLLVLSWLKKDSKLVAFADALICAGSVLEICSWWIKLHKLVQNLVIFQNRLRPS